MRLLYLQKLSSAKLQVTADKLQVRSICFAGKYGLHKLAAVDEYFLVFIALITFMELGFRATKAAFRASKTAAVATTASIAHGRSRGCVTASNINATHITYTRLF
jgi:hypothetical protein